MRRSDYSGVIRRSLILRRFQGDDGGDGVLGARNKMRHESGKYSIDFEFVTVPTELAPSSGVDSFGLPLLLPQGKIKSGR